MISPTVEIISYTPRPERVCTVAVKQTYRREQPGDLLKTITEDSVKHIMKNIARLGHFSTLEHACFTISFTNVSVFFEQFLIEHRMASYNVKSRRYVDFSESGFVVPDYFEERQNIKEQYVNHMLYLFDIYKRLLDKGIPREDARFVLPYCFKSSIIATMNLREIIHLLYESIYGRGKKFGEIKKIGEILLYKMKKLCPIVFSDLKILEKAGIDDEKEFEKLTKNLNFKKNKRDNVEILWHTEKPDDKVALSALIRHMKSNEIMLDNETKEKMIDIVLKSGRPRELEQVNFTFRINNLSLSILTHITRHRIHSLIVPSFTEIENKDYIMPKTIKNNKEAERLYKDAFERSYKFYCFLRSEGVPKEVLVYMYLSGNLIDIITTMNARELYHFFRLRCCLRAQWEVRSIANNMLKLVKERAPLTFKNAGPSCFFYGYCTEGKMTCGKFKEVYEDFEKWHKNMEGVPGERFV